VLKALMDDSKFSCGVCYVCYNLGYLFVHMKYSRRTLYLVRRKEKKETS